MEKNIFTQCFIDRYGIFIFIIFLNFGCVHKTNGTVPLQLEWFGHPTHHEVSSSALREKMQSLKVQMFDNIYDELQFDEEGARQAGFIRGAGLFWSSDLSQTIPKPVKSVSNQPTQLLGRSFNEIEIGLDGFVTLFWGLPGFFGGGI